MKKGKYYGRRHRGLPDLDHFPSYVSQVMTKVIVPVRQDRYRAKIKPWLREQLMARASRLCPHCAVHMRHPIWGDCEKEYPQGSDSRATIDHIIPISKGGSQKPDNMQIVCQRCNREKGASDAPPVATKSRKRTMTSQKESLYD